MQEALRDFCKGYQVRFEASPFSLSSSGRTQLIEDPSGKRWVVKNRSTEDPTPELLRGFSVLYPSFHYPRSVSDPRDPYLLYPYIEGKLLADGPFEAPEILEQVAEVIGRLRALMRSLVLVSHYTEVLHPGKSGKDPVDQLMDRFDLGRIQARDEKQKEARLREIAVSYHRTQDKTRIGCDLLRSQAMWSQPLLDRFQDYIRNDFSLHLPIMGNNLVHTGLHPEHILLCPDGNMGIVGWHIEPCPRFYMLHTYLAWSFLHSPQPDPTEHYRKAIPQDPEKAFYKEHQLGFAFCLLEQLTRCLSTISPGFRPSPERPEQARELFTECVGNYGRMSISRSTSV